MNSKKTFNDFGVLIDIYSVKNEYQQFRKKFEAIRKTNIKNDILEVRTTMLEDLSENIL